MLRETLLKPLLFISQVDLEAWVEQGKAALEDGVLTLQEESVAYRLEPGVRIGELLAGDDQAGLVGEIRTVVALQSAGAEYCRDSVIMGDTAYSCEEGFVCQQPEPPAEAAFQAGGQESAKNEKQSDADLLAEFLLKHI